MNEMADHRVVLERAGLSGLVVGAAFCLSMSFAYAQTLAVPAGQHSQLDPSNPPKQATASAQHTRGERARLSGTYICARRRRPPRLFFPPLCTS